MLKILITVALSSSSSVLSISSKYILQGRRSPSQESHMCPHRSMFTLFEYRNKAISSSWIWIELIEPESPSHFLLFDLSFQAYILWASHTKNSIKPRIQLRKLLPTSNITVSVFHFLSFTTDQSKDPSVESFFVFSFLQKYFAAYMIILLSVYRWKDNLGARKKNYHCIHPRLQVITARWRHQPASSFRIHKFYHTPFSTKHLCQTLPSHPRADLSRLLWKELVSSAQCLHHLHELPGENCRFFRVPNST